MTVVDRIKELPRGALLIIIAMLAIGSFVVLDSLFGILPRQYTKLCEYSGGAGETTTESFHLERHGKVSLRNYSMVLVNPRIEVHRVDGERPLCVMPWMYINDKWEPEDIGLDPGDYYIVVKANWGSSWTIVVEEAKSGL